MCVCVIEREREREREEGERRAMYSAWMHAYMYACTQNPRRVSHVISVVCVYVRYTLHTCMTIPIRHVCVRARACVV